MRKGIFIVSGTDSQIYEKTLKKLKNLAYQERLRVGELAIEESGGSQ